MRKKGELWPLLLFWGWFFWSIVAEEREEGRGRSGAMRPPINQRALDPTSMQEFTNTLGREAQKNTNS